jgi:hypothetical protein
MVFLHCNGEDCPAMRRARGKELTPDVMNICRGSAERLHATLEMHTQSEIAKENVSEKCSRFFLNDQHADYSAKWVVKDSGHDVNRVNTAITKNCSGANNGLGDDNGQRRRHCPGHESTSAFKSGRDALQAVAQPLGFWNWVFVGPDSEELPLVAGGDDSVDGMRKCLETNDTLVMFGLLRMSFGEKRLRRTKYVFVHGVGAKVSAVARGKLGEVRPKMLAAIEKLAKTSVALEIVNNLEDLSLEAAIEKIRKAAIIDDDVLEGDDAAKHIFSVDAFRAAQAEDRKIVSEEAPKGAVDTVAKETVRVPGIEWTLEEIVELVHTLDGPLNWLLLEANEEWMVSRRPTKTSQTVGPTGFAFGKLPSQPVGGYLGAQKRARRATMPASALCMLDLSAETEDMCLEACLKEDV